ncbi:MAG: hypothetical protein HQM11_07735 [SAR324 cluster bacterium]|nr:hypothetical protein [SAR324 cluster bacterium]
MAVPAIVETLENVPEALRELYAPIQVDGAQKYTLQLEGVPPGFVEKTKLNEFRENNTKLLKTQKELEERLKSYDGIEDPAKAKELMSREKEFAEKQLIDQGKFEELFNQRTSIMKKDHENQTRLLLERAEKAEKEREAFMSQLSETRLETRLQKAINDTAVPQKDAIDDIMARAKRSWKVSDEGQLYAVDESGNKRYGRNGNDLLSPEEWMTELAQNAKHLFLPSTGGGAKGANGFMRTTDGIVLTKEDAKNPVKYWAAKEQAQKAGTRVILGS